MRLALRRALRRARWSTLLRLGIEPQRDVLPEQIVPEGERVRMCGAVGTYRGMTAGGVVIVEWDEP